MSAVAVGIIGRMKRYSVSIMWLLPLGASFLYWGIGLLSLIFTAILSEPDRTIISIPGSQLKELVQVK